MSLYALIREDVTEGSISDILYVSGNQQLLESFAVQGNAVSNSNITFSVNELEPDNLEDPVLAWCFSVRFIQGSWADFFYVEKSLCGEAEVVQRNTLGFLPENPDVSNGYCWDTSIESCVQRTKNQFPNKRQAADGGHLFYKDVETGKGIFIIED